MVTANDGRLKLRIVGDILRIDRTRFASLVREVDKAPANVQEVSFDAREIMVADPLSFQSARLEFVCELFVFEPSGSVTLTQAPSGVEDGLVVHARRIDVSQATPIFQQILLAAGSARVVQPNAREIVVDDATLTGLVASRRLWEQSSRFDGINAPPQAAFWVTNIGTAGWEKARAAMRARSVWPAYTTYKLRKHHAIAPFDYANTAALSDRIAGLVKLFEDINEPEVMRDARPAASTTAAQRIAQTIT